MQRSSILLVAGLFLVIAVVIASCGSSKSTSPNPGGGGTGPSIDFSFPATGTSHSFTFADAGTWNYQCTPHGSCCGMRGVVVVGATGSDSAVVSVGLGNALVFSPDTVRIKTGHFVRWVNVSNATIHTVTR